MTPLDVLLDQAFQALLVGDLTALSGLDARIDAAAATLPALDRAAASALRHKAERNAKLLQAASRGVRSARERIAEIRLRPELATYDAKGRKSALSEQARALGRF
jgi:hypothetical protein